MKIFATALFLILNFQLYSFAQQEIPETEACQKMTQLLTNSYGLGDVGIQSDQLAISKNFETIFSWSDGEYKLDTPHAMWSASKTITATLVAAAIERGDLKLDDPLAKYFPKQLSDAIEMKRYNEITIENLINMSSGFKWDESYESDPIQSTFMPMLYGVGRHSMHEYALSMPIEVQPGVKWNYSGGNSNILMAILRKIYGSNQFAQDLLFRKIGMTTAFYEQDQSGNLVGSSYAYLALNDMLKLGELYLNNGAHNAEQILPLEWVQQAQMPTAAISREGNLTDPNYVKSEGVFSNRAFWLNQDVPAVQMTHEFANSPRDMYFAAGHYGQLIIILPTQKIVVALTGHNKEYWSKIDKIVWSTLSCLQPDSVGKYVEPSTASAPTAKSSLSKNLKLGSGVLSRGFLQGILAKELCSCNFVSGLSLESCVDRANLPMGKGQLNLLVNIWPDVMNDTLNASPTVFGLTLSKFKARRATAKFLGEGLGCQIQ